MLALKKQDVIRANAPRVAQCCTKLFLCAVIDRRDQIIVLTNGYCPSPRRM